MCVSYSRHGFLPSDPPTVSDCVVSYRILHETQRKVYNPPGNTYTLQPPTIVSAWLAALTIPHPSTAGWRGVPQIAIFDSPVDSFALECLDSGAGRTMSGNMDRLSQLRPTNVKITGFNSSASQASIKGINADGIEELYVPDMPNDRILLSLCDYTKGGRTALLGEHGGAILHIAEADLAALRAKNAAILEVGVNNGVYHVLRGHVDQTSPDFSFNVDSYIDESDVILYDQDDVELEVFAVEAVTNLECYYAAKYFNSKVHYDTIDELILGHIASGFPIPTLKQLVKSGSMTGLDPTLTVKAIDRYIKRHGSTPDIVKKSLPVKTHKMAGYEDTHFTVKNNGDCIEIDGMYYRFNETKVVSTGTLFKEIRQKVKTKGGAIAGFIAVDVWSQFIIPKLTPSTGQPVNLVREFVDIFRSCGINPKIIGADTGVAPVAMFRVLTGEVLEYLRQQHIRNRKAEPHPHSTGTATVEILIRWIKRFMDMAYELCFTNVTIEQDLHFTRADLISLWGEIFYWACGVLCCHENTNVPGKTRYEVFYGEKPNFQRIRFLPIFSVVMLLQERRAHEPDRTDPGYIYGLYVGPDWTPGGQLPVAGNIRVAVKQAKGGIGIICTSAYTHVTQGGQVNLDKELSRGAVHMITGVPLPPATMTQGISLPDNPAYIPTTTLSNDSMPIVVPNNMPFVSESETDPLRESTIPPNASKSGSRGGEEDQHPEVSTLRHESSDSGVLPSDPGVEFTIPTPKSQRARIPKIYNPQATGRSREERQRTKGLQADLSPTELIALWIESEITRIKTEKSTEVPASFT